MKKLAFFITLLFLVSCTSNTIYKAPKDLIPKDTMVLLITDMFLANSAQHKKNNELKKVSYMPFVSKKYKIDSIRFKASNTYYISRIDAYEIIFDQIKLNLEAEKEKYASVKEAKDSLRKDSLQKVRARVIPKKEFIEKMKMKNLLPEKGLVKDFKRE